eukprot:1176565-Prorocentrum_minimum.AAC.1
MNERATHSVPRFHEGAKSLPSKSTFGDNAFEIYDLGQNDQSLSRFWLRCVKVGTDSKKESKEKKAEAEAGAKALMKKIREQLAAFDNDFKAKAES